MPKDDDLLLTRSRSEEIVCECYGEVLAYCRRHAPAGYEAADLAQETFLRFVRTKSYRERGKPIAYLLRIARNVCIDAGRKRRLETVELSFDIEDESAMPGISDPLGVEAALASLPCELNDVIELRYGSGLEVNEVAKVLGISRFAVRRKINAALKLLKCELEEGGFDG